MSSISVLTRKSIADVTKRKGRTALMIIGIVIGVLGLTAVSTANEMIGAAFVFTNNTSTVPDIIFSVNTAPASLITSLQHASGVSVLQMRASYMTSWYVTNGFGTNPVQINAYPDLQHVQLGTFQVTSGRLPGMGEIVMDSSDVQVEPISLGDMVKIDIPGGTTSLRVVGLARTADQNLRAPATAYMSQAALQQLVPLGSSTVDTAPPQPTKGSKPGAEGNSQPALTTDILLKASDANHVLQAYNSCSALLKRTPDVQLYSSSLHDPKGDIINTQIAVPGLLNIIAALALIAVLLVCLMIFNTVNTLLAEQMKIIGTMKAIGGTRWRIAGSYLLSIGIYGVVGTLIGIGLGVLAGWQLSYLVASLANVDLGPFQIAPWIILFSIAIGLLAPLLSALLPLWTGTRITVHEAMSAYGVSANAGKRTVMWGKGLTWVPQTALLGLRGIFRKPARATITLLALALSGAVFMAVQITNESIGSALRHADSTFSYDMGIFVDATQSQSALKAIQGVQGIRFVEPHSEHPVTTSVGQLSLVGLPVNSQTYQPHLIAGRWLLSDDVGTLVLSDIAAQRLGVHVGDSVTLQPGELQVNWKVVGIVHELANATGSANVGGPIGMGFSTLQNINVNLEKLPANSVQLFLIGAQNPSPQALSQLQDNTTRALNNAGISNVGIKLARQHNVNSSELIVYSLFYTVAVIVALVGLLSLSNTLSAEALERRLEIGVLRSLGATGRRVGLVFWIEGLALAGCAWALGALIGVPGGSGILALLSAIAFPLEAIFSPLFILTTLLFVIVVSFLASYGPTLAASRVRIRETLRYE